MTVIERIAAWLGVAQPNTATDRAVAELSAYSDRELAELGISRGSIRQAVLHGRPGIDVPASAPHPVNDDHPRGTGRHKAA